MKNLHFRIIILSLLIFASIPIIKGQNYYGIKISQNATSFPIMGIPKLFPGPLHPGLTVIYESKLKEKGKKKFLNEINAGFFYQRFFQLGIQLNDVVKYNYAFSPRWSAFTGLGGGYMHSFYRYDIFKLNSDGEYDHISSWRGRPQFMGVFTFGASMGLQKNMPDKMRLSLEFRSFVHGTFAKSYVPIVPYNSILLGISIKVKEKLTSKTPVK